MLNRRTFVALAAATPFTPARAGQPWSARLIKGAGFEGGLHLVLQPGWKTYWRVPGAGGIPPEITASGSNLAGFAFSCPVPKRFPGEDGETIGYKDEVVFPFTATPLDASQPLSLEISAFIGVCEVVCIPVSLKQQLTFGTTLKDSPLLSRWQQRVPQVMDTGPVAAARLQPGPEPLALTMTAPANDIFVEGNALHNYHAPRFEGETAHLAVSGLKDPEKLRGEQLRLTVVTGDRAVEQRITVL